MPKIVQDRVNLIAELPEKIRETADELALGLTCGEIAKKRSLATKTVDAQRHVALRRLGLRNVVDLARLAIAEGRVPMPTLPPGAVLPPADLTD